MSRYEAYRKLNRIEDAADPDLMEFRAWRDFRKILDAAKTILQMEAVMRGENIFKETK